MMKLQIELLLFAGGDGTARGIYSSIKNAVPVIGIPRSKDALLGLCTQSQRAGS